MATLCYSILAFIGSMAIVLSLSEIASIYPTAGGRPPLPLARNPCIRTANWQLINKLCFVTGQYHWVALLAPEKRRAIASWATGWISVSGQTILGASCAFAAGLQLQSLIVINDESYDRPRWQGVLFYWAILTYAAVVNIFGIKLLPNINLVAGNYFLLHSQNFVPHQLFFNHLRERQKLILCKQAPCTSPGLSPSWLSWGS